MNIILLSLSEFNTSLFYFINLGMENPLFNFIMPIITDLGDILFWAVACGLLFLSGGEKSKKIAILCLFSLLISFSMTLLLKYLIAEPRPYLVLNNVNTLHMEDNYSFPSSHAATAFAGSLILGRKYGFLIPFIALATLIGFSRIYIGVHYPFDVIFGAAVGIFSASITLKFEKRILNRYTNFIKTRKTTSQ
jgi:undecaprenyl-diphosphatase